MSFAVFAVKRRDRKVWVLDRRSGERVRRSRPAYDVRYRADGHDFRYSFDQKGWADSFALKLREGFARGWPFDPRSRRFLDPDAGGENSGHSITVFEHFTDYVGRKWGSWEPATRRNTQRDLARACLFLVRSDAPPLSRADRQAAYAFLREVAFMVPRPDVLDSGHERWARWFPDWSRPLATVTDEHLQAFLDDVASAGVDGARRQLAPSSIARTRASVRAAFTHARKRRLIEWDPWEPVQAPTLRDLERVDPDLVMSPDQVRAVARACAAVDARWEAFVLVQGLCGLRPGEAVALRRRDVACSNGLPVAITVRGTQSSVPERFFAPGESRRRPLKGRGRMPHAPSPSLRRCPSRSRGTFHASQEDGRAPCCSPPRQGGR